jgi:transcriptional regulator with XRE-family HTH domain
MKPETTDIMFAQNLARIRKERCLKLETLAEISGVSASSIRNYEKARTSPNTLQLRLLAKALKVDFNELLGGYPNNRETHNTIMEIVFELRKLLKEWENGQS